MFRRKPKAPLPCALCYADRLRRWRDARAANGIPANEWPAPLPPMFKDDATLARHIRETH
jgi:hypothetical protein